MQFYKREQIMSIYNLVHYIEISPSLKTIFDYQKIYTNIIKIVTKCVKMFSLTGKMFYVENFILQTA